MTHALVANSLPIPSPLGSLDAYIGAVHQIPVLTVDDEQTLARRYRDDDDLDAARELVHSHLRFVVHVARGYNGYGLPLGDLIQATFYEAVVEQKLNPAGAPAVEPKSFEKGKDLEYVATFEVFPEFEVTGFDSIAIERLQAEVADSDVDNMLDILRKQRRTFAQRPAAESAADGDRVTDLSIRVERLTALGRDDFLL